MFAGSSRFIDNEAREDNGMHDCVQLLLAILSEIDAEPELQYEPEPDVNVLTEAVAMVEISDKPKPKSVFIAGVRTGKTYHNDEHHIMDRKPVIISLEAATALKLVPCKTCVHDADVDKVEV